MLENIILQLKEAKAKNLLSTVSVYTGPSKTYMHIIFKGDRPTPYLDQVQAYLISKNFTAYETSKNILYAYTSEQITEQRLKELMKA